MIGIPKAAAAVLNKGICQKVLTKSIDYPCSYLLNFKATLVRSQELGRSNLYKDCGSTRRTRRDGTG